MKVSAKTPLNGMSGLAGQRHTGRPDLRDNATTGNEPINALNGGSGALSVQNARNGAMEAGC